MKAKKILSILMVAAAISATPFPTSAVPPKTGNSQAKEQDNETMPFMDEYTVAKLAVDDVAKNIPQRTNIHPQSKKYYDNAYQKAKKDRLNKQGFDDAMNGNPKEKFEDKQNADWYNEGYTKGKVVYAYQMGVDDGSTGRPNQREFFADNLDSLQNYDRGRLRGINILASEDREKKTNRRNLLTNEDELKLYDKVYKEMASKFHHKDY